MSELEKWSTEYHDKRWPDSIYVSDGALKLLSVAKEIEQNMEDGPHNSYWAGMKAGMQDMVRQLSAWCGDEVNTDE